jgi:hypothetical protein
MVVYEFSNNKTNIRNSRGDCSRRCRRLRWNRVRDDDKQQSIFLSNDAMGDSGPQTGQYVGPHLQSFRTCKQCALPSQAQDRNSPSDIVFRKLFTLFNVEQDSAQSTLLQERCRSWKRMRVLKMRS